MTILNVLCLDGRIEGPAPIYWTAKLEEIRLEPFVRMANAPVPLRIGNRRCGVFSKYIGAVCE
jgi:hypothetical protein